jgi:hypothetical protein
MQIKIEDFEKCLECWKTLYRLDDGIYKIILGEPKQLELLKVNLDDLGQWIRKGIRPDL